VDKGNHESEGDPIKDPHWLVAVNSMSIAVAVFANVALLAHTTNLLRFNIAAPVVIVGWYISGLLDIALVSAAPQHLPLPDVPSATWSQAYWYAMFSGIIYIVLSTMLLITAHGVWVQRHSRSFKLSTAQRMLMVHTILFLVYVLGSGAVYARIEGWRMCIPDAEDHCEVIL
jgi:potassium channel subfamily K, other eukaryote